MSDAEESPFDEPEFDEPEFDEPELLDGSHLVMTTCCVCRKAPAAAIPERAHEARCLTCAMDAHGAKDRWDLTAHPRFAAPDSDPRAYAVRPADVSTNESVCPVCRVTSRKDKCNWVREENRLSAPVSSRDGVGGVYPAAVLKVAEKAREAGWEVRQQYAVGWGWKLVAEPGEATKKRVATEVPSYALIFSGHPMTVSGAYAVYRGKSWQSVNIAGMALGGVTDLLHWLETGGQVNGEAHWFQHLRALKEDATRRADGVKKRNAEIKALYAAGAVIGDVAWTYRLTEDQVRKIVAPTKSKKEDGG